MTHVQRRSHLPRTNIHDPAILELNCPNAIIALLFFALCHGSSRHAKPPSVIGRLTCTSKTRGRCPFESSRQQWGARFPVGHQGLDKASTPSLRPSPGRPGHRRGTSATSSLLSCSGLPPLSAQSRLDIFIPATTGGSYSAGGSTKPSQPEAVAFALFTGNRSRRTSLCFALDVVIFRATARLSCLVLLLMIAADA